VITQLTPFRLMSSFKKSEIRMLFKTARNVYHQNGLVIKQAPKTGDLGRILIVTPRKAGNAPQRNLIRRRIKNIFYLEKLFNNAQDWIILVSSDATLLSFDALKKIILSLQEKNKL